MINSAAGVCITLALHVEPDSTPAVLVARVLR